jgi:vWA-MoxR associated protein C-terminal domain/vWA-MoxR associated protein middle region (VMAP-M) 8/Trypsin-like peptidase domain
MGARAGRLMSEWRWRARVETEAGTVLGAGFLLDPTRVLTCAHVVQGLERARVAFPGVADGLAVTVRTRTGWTRLGDEGDLAVLELDAPVAIPPARFAHRDVLRRRPRTELGAYGFPKAKGTSGAVVELRTRPDMDLQQEWWQLNVPDAHLETLAQGFSGAAVYLADTGEVVGMVTDRDRATGTGRMLPLRSLRRHWEDIDDLLDLDWLTPELRRGLRQAVRDAVPDVALDAVYRDVFPGMLGAPSPRSVWDAIRYVAEEQLEEDALTRFLARLLHHLDGRSRHRLAAWMAQHLPAAHPAGDATPNSLIVRLHRMTRGGTYELTLLTLVDGVTGPSRGPMEVRESDVRERVEETLPAVRDALLGGRDWIIEFALPVSLFNEPFETWYIEKENGIRMRAYPVVLRDVDRMNPASIRRDLTLKRWRRLRERGTTEPWPVRCRARYADDEFHDRLDADEDACVVAYAASPSRGRLRAALNAGVPVMLWPRLTCDEAGDEAGDGAGDDAGERAECAGERRLRALTEAIDGVHPDDLPDAVMMLRKRARIADGDHVGRELTLVWDDPARMPDPPLAMGV